MHVILFLHNSLFFALCSYLREWNWQAESFKIKWKKTLLIFSVIEDKVLIYMEKLSDVIITSFIFGKNNENICNIYI